MAIMESALPCILPKYSITDNLSRHASSIEFDECYEKACDGHPVTSDGEEVRPGTRKNNRKKGNDEIKGSSVFECFARQKSAAAVAWRLGAIQWRWGIHGGSSRS